MLRHVNYCIDDKIPLEIAHIMVYTKQWEQGVGVSMFEYCPRCGLYLSYGKMEKDLSELVALWMKNNRFNPRDFIRAERV